VSVNPRPESAGLPKPDVCWVSLGNVRLRSCPRGYCSDAILIAMWDRFRKGWHRLHDLHTLVWLIELAIAALGLGATWLPWVQSHFNNVLTILTDLLFLGFIVWVIVDRTRKKRHGAGVTPAPVVLPIVPQTQPEPLLRVSFDYLPDSPLKHGWELAPTDETIAPKLTALPNDALVSEGLSIFSPGWSGIHYAIPPFAMVANRLKFTAKFSQNGRFYVLAKMTSKDASSAMQDGWIQFTPIPNPQMPSQSGNERKTSLSGTHLGNGWMKYDITLDYEVRKLYGHDGLIFSHLLSLRIRGTVQISAIELYEPQKVAAQGA
jgi:hypothetical protein